MTEGQELIPGPDNPTLHCTCRCNCALGLTMDCEPCHFFFTHDSFFTTVRETKLEAVVMFSSCSVARLNITVPHPVLNI